MLSKTLWVVQNYSLVICFDLSWCTVEINAEKSQAYPFFSESVRLALCVSMGLFMASDICQRAMLGCSKIHTYLKIFAPTSFSHRFYLIIQEIAKKRWKSYYLRVRQSPSWFTTLESWIIIMRSFGGLPRVATGYLLVNEVGGHYFMRYLLKNGNWLLLEWISK